MVITIKDADFSSVKIGEVSNVLPYVARVTKCYINDAPSIRIGYIDNSGAVQIYDVSGISKVKIKAKGSANAHVCGLFFSNVPTTYNGTIELTGNNDANALKSECGTWIQNIGASAAQDYELEVNVPSGASCLLISVGPSPANYDTYYAEFLE